MVLPAGVIATWVASAAASDAYTRAVDAARTKEEEQMLRIRAGEDTGYPFSRKHFERWYDLDETWDSQRR